MTKCIVCSPKPLPRELWIKAAESAIAINPVNRPPVHRLTRVMPGFAPTKAHLSVLTTKYWGAKGVKLTVGFLDNPSADLRKKILAHMNAWSKTANVAFVASSVDPQVRIARTPGDGYWSYLGTDVLQIEKSQPTMNLDSFTLATPEAEYRRVVRHETGHTLGFPHEHMRKTLVAKIDEEKAIEYFRRTQGWSPEQTRLQVLTPLEEGSLIGTATADDHSIMCYQIPGEITKDGQPIPGGLDIDNWDYDFAARIYPSSKSGPKGGKKAGKKVTKKRGGGAKSPTRKSSGKKSKAKRRSR